MTALTAVPAASNGAVVGVSVILAVALYVVACLGFYGTFQKAGQPGWAAFVPIYNFYIILRIVGRPEWWLVFVLLPLVPVVGSIALLVVTIIVMNDLSKSFGRGTGFTVGLVLLPWVFSYILWLGSSTYRGPAAAVPGGSYPQPPYPQQPYGQAPYGQAPYPQQGAPPLYPQPSAPPPPPIAPQQPPAHGGPQPPPPPPIAPR